LQLRASEAMMRMLLTSVAATTEQNSRMVQSAYDRIAHLEEKRMREFDLREELMGRQNEREMEMASLLAGEARKDRLFDRAEKTLAPLLPEIGRKLKLLPPKKEGGKTGENRSEKALKAFVDSLSEAQQKVIFDTLKPEQAALILAAMPEDSDDSTPDDSKEKVS
jgi:hypothetical protein